MNIVDRFVHFHLDYVEVVLEPAVSRAASADDNISKNTDLQRQLNQTTFGLCVIYHLAFIQSALGENWDTLKRFNSRDRENYNIDWNVFDLLKYIRDCFAHDPDGELFPSDQNNTIRFRAEIDNHPNLKIKVMNNRLCLSPSTVQQSFYFFERLLREITT